MTREWGKILRKAAAILLAALLFALGGWSALAQDMTAAEDITKQCHFKVTEGKKGHLTDRNFRSDWTYEGQDAQVAVELPEGVSAGTMMVYWTFEPTAYQVLEYDQNKNLLRQRDESCTFPSIETCLDLMPETRYVFLHLTAPDQSIAEMRFYSQGTLPEKVHVWNPPVEKADLMVVSTHQDDELIFFGGVIPYYAVAQQRPTVVVYMANCTRSRRQEALSGLWVMGVRDYPDFINLRDKRVESIEKGIELWGGKEHILEELVERIRRYKPEVIVTHDFGGEYGHNQHKITALAMQYAIDAAADASRFSDSASRYGVWQVKKLYIHLYGENQVHMDWKTPLDALGGLSPLEMAKKGYAEHVSQQDYYQVKDGGKYDNALFGLYFSTVGQDTGLNDMFEHIDSSVPASSPTPEPAPAATAEPQPAAMQPEETPEILPEATVLPEPVPETPARHGKGVALGLLGGAAAVGGGILGLHIRAERRRRRRRRARRGVRRR